jgi:hypothetical protein
MSFTPIEQKQTYAKKKLEFLNLVPGNTVIRILDEDYVSVESHFINRVSIACLGDECPICKNNRKTIMENPETFRDISGYSPKSTRYFLNVMDKTPARICPQCGKEVKQNIPTCPGCNTVIQAVPQLPLNKVKILSKGKQLFEQFIAMEQTIVDEQGNKRGLQNFDITLSVAGAGKTATCTAIFTGAIGTPVTVTPEDKFDLEKAIVRLNVEEIHDLQSGVSLSDIFKARSLTSEKDPVAPTSESLAGAVESAMKLFEQ